MVTENDETGDMKLNNRGRLLLHLQTGRDRFSALGGDRGSLANSLAKLVIESYNHKMS